MRSIALACLMCLPGVPTDPQDEAVRKAVQALVNLKDGDEEGFDAQADVLLKAGATALPALEEKLTSVTGEPGFRLQRIRDMIVWPLGVKGVLAYRVGNPAFKRHNSLEVGMVALSVNGRPALNKENYIKLSGELSRRKDAQAEFEVLHQGVKKVAKSPYFNTGMWWCDYPTRDVEYIHQGHRGLAWDALVQEGLGLHLEGWRIKAGDALARAIEAGCRDPVVLVTALESFRGGSACERAREVWKESREKVNWALHRGKWRRYAEVQAGLALLESGDAEGAAREIVAALQSAQKAGDETAAALARCALAASVQDKDSGRALALLKEGVPKIADFEVRRSWAEQLIRVLKMHGKWGELPAWGSIYDSLTEQKQRSKTEALRMMAQYGSGPKTLVPTARLFSSEAAAAKGVGDGLLGTYFASEDHTGKSVQRIDPLIRFDWGEGAPHPEIPADHFSVRWTGKIDPPHTDTYTFTTRTDDGIRLWVDGKKIIDRWVGQAPTEYSGTIALTAGKKVDLKMEHYDGIRGAVAELYWACPSMNAGPTKPAGPAHWALVYRLNFDAAEPAERSDDRQKLYHMVKPEGGKLRWDAEQTGTGFFSWGVYGPDVRVELDGDLNPYPDQDTWPDRALSVNALFTYRANSEVGCSFAFPRRFEGHLLFAGIGSGHYVPWLDGRKPHRLAVECVRGWVEQRIDGRTVDTQFVPPHWRGRAGARMTDCRGSVDNFEVYVGSDQPVDNAKIRRLYDAASEAYNRNNLAGALGHFEEVASLQPRVDDLGHLYASYVVSRKTNVAEALRLVRERLAGASNPQTIGMLLHAERHAELFLIEDTEEFEAARGTSIGVWDAPPGLAIQVRPESMNRLKASTGTGRLAEYTEALRAQFERGHKGFAEVEAAYRHAMKQDPDAVGHAYRLWTFYRSQKKTSEAASLLPELKARLPRAEALK